MSKEIVEVPEDETLSCRVSIATALAEQRILRKQTSADVRILANRIALLKVEEQKVSSQSN
jgi:hypothetical protein